MNNGYYFTDKMLAEQYAAKTNLQQRIYEYSQLGVNKRLKPSTNRFTQIITEKKERTLLTNKRGVCYHPLLSSAVVFRS